MMGLMSEIRGRSEVAVENILEQNASDFPRFAIRKSVKLNNELPSLEIQFDIAASDTDIKPSTDASDQVPVDIE